MKKLLIGGLLCAVCSIAFAGEVKIKKEDIIGVWHATKLTWSGKLIDIKPNFTFEFKANNTVVTQQYSYGKQTSRSSALYEVEYGKLYGYDSSGWKDEWKVLEISDRKLIIKRPLETIYFEK